MTNNLNPLYVFKWFFNTLNKISKQKEPTPGYIPAPPEPPFPIMQNVTLPSIIIETTEFDPTQFDKPILWKYYPDKSRKIWIAKNYQEYITPDTELVSYFTDNIEFLQNNNTIHIQFKNKEPINFKYRIDDARLCRESGQDYKDCWDISDFWMNPDYYIWNKFEGDCDDYALLMASVFEKLKIPYMVITGYQRTALGNIGDTWVEFLYNNEPWIAQVNLNRGNMARKISMFREEYIPFEMYNKTTEIIEYTKWYDEK